MELRAKPMDNSSRIWSLRRAFAPRSRIVTMGAQAAVLDAESRVLLVRHGYRPGWHFPGGGVERSETVQAAIERELREETGVEMTEPPRLFGVYSHFDAFPGDHIALFVVRAWRQPSRPAPNSEIAEQGFFAPTALPEGTTPGTRRRLAEILSAGRPEEAW